MVSRPLLFDNEKPLTISRAVPAPAIEESLSLNLDSLSQSDSTATLEVYMEIGHHFDHRPPQPVYVPLLCANGSYGESFSPGSQGPRYTGEGRVSRFGAGSSHLGKYSRASIVA